ncbi:histone H2A-like [Carcharodon carcharias]|uniref:histone H2A-like n=1 Tax=Carcharodon carcharias TaxID=13397 RepID=UPI001B7DA9A4|nr:histone H2A-like [Carcharodon carcharias]
MSCHGKTGGKGCAKAKICSSKAYLQLPVGCIHQLLCKGRFAGRVWAGALIYLAAVLEYLKARASSWPAMQPGTTPTRHLQLSIHNDQVCNNLLGGVTIAQGGVLRNIQAVLRPKKTGHPARFMPEGARSEKDQFLAGPF